MFISLVFLIESIISAYEETNSIRNFNLNSVLAVLVDENGNLVSSLPTQTSDTPFYLQASFTLLWCSTEHSTYVQHYSILLQATVGTWVNRSYLIKLPYSFSTYGGQ